MPIGRERSLVSTRTNAISLLASMFKHSRVQLKSTSRFQIRSLHSNHLHGLKEGNGNFLGIQKGPNSTKHWHLKSLLVHELIIFDAHLMLTQKN